MASNYTRPTSNLFYSENFSEQLEVLVFDGWGLRLTPTTTLERDNDIRVPDRGLIIYNHELNAFEYYDGFVWQPFGGGGGGGGTVTNALSGTYLDGTTVKLGGELLANTNIPGNNFDLDFGTKTNKLGSLRIQHTTTFTAEGTDATTYLDETYKTTIAAQTTDGLVLLRSAYDYIPTLDSFSKEIRLDTRSGEQGIIIIDTYDDRGLAGEVLFELDGSDEQYIQQGHVIPIFEELRTYYRTRTINTTSPSSVLLYDRLVYLTGAGTTINLPAPPDIVNGRTYTFKNISGGNVTLQVDGGVLIEGLATLVLSDGESVTINYLALTNAYYIIQ